MRVITRMRLGSWPARRLSFFGKLLRLLGGKVRRPEPRRLTVSDVRQAIWAEAPPASGQSWGPAVGSLFHRVAQGLADPASPCGWARYFDHDNLEDAVGFERHAYERLAGPLLSRHAGALQERSLAALALWQATQQLCRWLQGALRSAHGAGLIAYDAASERWQGAETLVRTEADLVCELREPSWLRPVRIEGRADAVWRRAQDGHSCVIEYKLGAGQEEADLLQTCLYRAMLASGDGPASNGGALALLRFTPQPVELFFPAERLDEVQQRLLDLIGRLAGVLPGETAAVAATAPAPEPERTNPEFIDPNAEQVAAVFDEFNVPVELLESPIAGPTFLRFFLRPRHGVDVKRLLKQNINLQVRLGLSAPPFLHIADGRVACDLQRKNRQTIPFERIEAAVEARRDGSSRVLIGVDLQGKPYFADLSEPTNAHILAAGCAGSGKSEWMRCALASLLRANTPDTLRLLLIDPKRSAFNELRGSPYLLDGLEIQHPPEDDVVAALERLVAEMEDRYRLLEAAGADDLAKYRPADGARPPRIICFCDEYYDLIEGDKGRRRQIESTIGRLGAKARAAGIHLILATQKPSRDVVKGALSANMSCRVGLKTNSAIESRMIIHRAGAENLLGRGDLFFVDIGAPQRLQAPLLSPGDRKRIFGSP